MMTKLRCCEEMLPGHPSHGLCQRGHGHEGGHSPYDIDDAVAALHPVSKPPGEPPVPPSLLPSHGNIKRPAGCR